MPIPAAPRHELTTSTAVVALMLQLHEELRELVACDHDTLNCVPCPGSNSIATIVTHLLGSEAEALRSVAGVDRLRDRDAEFRMDEQASEALLGQLDRADALLAELAPALTDDRLQTLVALPTLPESETRPGMTWLIGTLGHSREHLGHAHLTKQLHLASS
jgi:DinB superfamily